MTPNDRTEPGVCPRCGNTRLMPIGDGYSVNPCPNCTGQQTALVQRVPDGYAYRYPDGYIRHNDGREVNGSKPTEVLPWFYSTTVADMVAELTTKLTAERTGQQPAQPGSGEVDRWIGELRYLAKHGYQLHTNHHNELANFIDRLQSALAAAKAYSDDLETRYHTAHERLTAAQQRIAHLEARLAGERASSECGQMALEMLKGRIADLESELKNERARGIHTCHDQCERPLCVAQRRIAALESGLSEAIEIMTQGERLLPEGEARFRLILEDKEPS